MNELIVKNVDVLGDSIMAAKDKDGVIWVGIRWMCQGMGMSDGQFKRQITNIQNDLLLRSSGSNVILNTGAGAREVFCLKLDYLPIWLAKISITPNIQQEHPELAAKLLNYQLKAKDILAAAFLPKQVTAPVTVQDQIKLLAQGNVELNQRMDTLNDRMDRFEKELPLFPSEAEEVSLAATRRGIMILGGKKSAAYKNPSIRASVYRNLYIYLNYNFGTKRYKEIKRGQLQRAVEVAENWQPPAYLAEEIDRENATI